MREYQPIRNNPNWIPHNQYMQTVFFIRSYDELRTLYRDLLDESSGSGPSSGPGDPTSARAIKAERVHDDIRIIEDGLRSVPKKYRGIIWKNIQEKVPLTHLGVRTDRTYAFWKGVFIRKVAEEKRII